jgi:hypothetical protein
MPVGTAVPSGYYNRQSGQWEPSEDGVVLRILSIDGTGRAEIDVNGDASADTGSALTNLGIGDGERTALAALFAVDQTLWRMRLAHFSAEDFNFGARFGPDAN